MIITNIVWDNNIPELDLYDIPLDDLPETVTLADDIDEDEIADVLSDMYGWCVISYNIEKA